MRLVASLFVLCVLFSCKDKSTTEDTTTLEKENKQSTINKEAEIMSFPEACVFLKVSKSYLYKLTGSRKIPCYCPTGKKIIFKREELLNWAFSKPQIVKN